MIILFFKQMLFGKVYKMILKKNKLLNIYSNSIIFVKVIIHILDKFEIHLILLLMVLLKSFVEILVVIYNIVWLYKKNLIKILKNH